MEWTERVLVVPSAARAKPLPVTYVPSLLIHSATRLPESSNSRTLADMLPSGWCDDVFFLEEYVQGYVDADDQVDLHVSDLAWACVS